MSVGATLYVFVSWAELCVVSVNQLWAYVTVASGDVRDPKLFVARPMAATANVSRQVRAITTPQRRAYRLASSTATPLHDNGPGAGLSSDSLLSLPPCQVAIARFVDGDRPSARGAPHQGAEAAPSHPKAPSNAAEGP